MLAGKYPNFEPRKFDKQADKSRVNSYNQLRVKDKAQFSRKCTEGRENRPMVNQLHSFLTTRGGSQGSC